MMVIRVMVERCTMRVWGGGLLSTTFQSKETKERNTKVIVMDIPLQEPTTTTKHHPQQASKQQHHYTTPTTPTWWRWP
jgi:hypothetical protein